jgi:hypothetical protein
MVDAHGVRFSFRELWVAADRLRSGAPAAEATLASLLLAHASYEGFLNHIIDTACSAEYERAADGSPHVRGTIGKTVFLSEFLPHQMARDARPYRTVAEMHAWRNRLLHSRSVTWEGVRSAIADAISPRDADSLLYSVLRRSEFIAQCFADIPQLADGLLAAAVRHFPGTFCELGTQAMWGPATSGGADLRTEPS